eukprot:5944175-Pleurochrysis_carterae.AAC.2
MRLDHHRVHCPPPASLWAGWIQHAKTCGGQLAPCYSCLHLLFSDAVSKFPSAARGCEVTVQSTDKHTSGWSLPRRVQGLSGGTAALPGCSRRSVVLPTALTWCAERSASPGCGGGLRCCVNCCKGSGPMRGAPSWPAGRSAEPVC